MLYIRSLAATERGLLRQRHRTVPASIASRARVILLSADGWSVPAIATLLGCRQRTVRKWLHAFAEHGLVLQSHLDRESSREMAWEANRLICIGNEPTRSSSRLIS